MRPAILQLRSRAVRPPAAAPHILIMGSESRCSPVNVGAVSVCWTVCRHECEQPGMNARFFVTNGLQGEVSWVDADEPNSQGLATSASVPATIAGTGLAVAGVAKRRLSLRIGDSKKKQEALAAM